MGTSDGVRKGWTPERRKAHSDRIKELHREGLRYWSPEARAAQSERTKQQHARGELPPPPNYPRSYGADHPNWVGDAASYITKHNRVKTLRGKASSHACVDCANPARCWSWVQGTDGLNPATDFEPRCSSCHVKYDRTAPPTYRYVAKDLPENDVHVLRTGI